MNMAKKTAAFLGIFVMYLIGWGAYFVCCKFALNQNELIPKLLIYVLALAAALAVSRCITRILVKFLKSRKAFLIGQLALTAAFICILTIPLLNGNNSIIDEFKWLSEGGIADYNKPMLLVLAGLYFYQLAYHVIVSIAFSAAYKLKK